MEVFADSWGNSRGSYGSPSGRWSKTPPSEDAEPFKEGSGRSRGTGYSWRSASIGSRREAFRAG
ncbi:MAG: hypothetical protein Kow00128_24230 [Deltaproteobacteria bacterium]